ncbi:TolC family protein [Roseiconus nitratireducens]|uniref:TolC family protein n=2 Tax=Roseiconus nitratireducens TaxID=2605748 RepID=A0A5M6DJB9_9BACT|nr:TolC family protein [Roseiconus nitratireducens]
MPDAGAGIGTGDAELLPAPPGTAEETESPDSGLQLSDVIASLYRFYPEITQARELGRIANGELVSAYGAYDTKFNAHSLSEPTGFYRNYRNGLGLARQTWWGGYLSAGYRIGRGYYQPWYKERQTDDAGEFKLSVATPLLQGRAIDAERVAVFQASLARQAATPQVQKVILDTSLQAATVYWDWVAAGAILQAREELLDLAERRGEQFEAGLEAGKFAEIDVVLNNQLIAERRAILLKSQQKYRATSFKLALFLRDEEGQPLVPNDQWLPEQFPEIEMPTTEGFEQDLAAAISRRPEPQILRLQLQQTNLDRRLAYNQMLPNLDFVAEASQDMGAPATKDDDKGWFELVIGFRSEVPIQRRKARGKVQSTSAKMIQINEKIRLVQDKIATELLTAFNALTLASEIVEQTEISLLAAIDTLERYRFAFERGKIDLIYLNLLETKTNEAEIKLVEAQRDWFLALASLQVTLGLDPLDQAVVVSSLPSSKVPGPGHLPSVSEPDPEAFERDWKTHSVKPE